MASLGKTSIAGTSRANLGGNEEDLFGPYVLNEDGFVNTMSIYLDGNGPGVGPQVLKLLIYTDASNPNALKVVSDEISIPDGAAAQWFDAPVSNVFLPGQGGIPYWLGWHAGLVDVGSAFYQSAGSRVFKTRSYAAGPLDPLGAPTGSDAFGACIYATYFGRGGGFQ